jgi:hypothetical protein
MHLSQELRGQLSSQGKAVVLLFKMHNELFGVFFHEIPLLIERTMTNKL